MGGFSGPMINTGTNAMSTSRRRTTSPTAPIAPAPTQPGGALGRKIAGRRRPPGAPIIGQAVPRNPEPEIPAMARTSPLEGLDAAAQAALRQRRRGVGMSVLTGRPPGGAAPRARLAARTLIGY